jgi:hypothetical protein
MAGLEVATSALTLPAWAVGGAAALFIVIAVLALWRAGAGVAAAIMRVTLVVAACAAVLLLLQQNAVRERMAERRALDQRAADLAARVVAPGSPLACLDAVAGDAVETACEKAVFASPTTAAAAVSYVTARLALLSDAVEYARRTGGNYESALATLRVSIESDRYGIVAHVLSVRDSCTPLLCDSYVLFKDPDRVQANLRDRLFDHYVERYAVEWARAPASGTPVAEGQGANYTTASAPSAAPAAGPAAPTTAPAATVAAPLSSKYDFPSAASIPPVSIMTSEPGMPPETKPAPPAASAAAPAAHRRPPPRAAARTAPPSPPPQQIGPPPSTQSAPTAANGPALR